MNVDSIHLGLTAKGRVIAGEPTADLTKMKDGKFFDVTEEFIDTAMAMFQNNILELQISETEKITIIGIRHPIDDNPVKEILDTLEKLQTMKAQKAAEVLSRVSRHNKDGSEFKGILDAQGKVIHKRHSGEVKAGEEPEYRSQKFEERGPDVGG